MSSKILIIVLVLNLSGMNFSAHGRRVLPVRELDDPTERQSFAFEDEEQAQSFAEEVNAMEKMEAEIVTGSDELSEEEAEKQRQLAAEQERIKAEEEEEEAAKQKAAEEEAAKLKAAEEEAKKNAGQGDSTGNELHTAESLKAKDVTELKAMCKEAGITGYSRWKEEQLIDALLAKQVESNQE